MDPRCVYLQKHQLPELIDTLIAKLVEAAPPNPKQYLSNQLTAMADAKYSDADQCYNPAFSKTMAAKAVSREAYTKLRHAHTATGSSIDDCLADGLDFATGCRPVITGAVALPGLAACDEDCFVTLADVFEEVIKARHGIAFTQRSAAYYVNDVTINKVRGGFSFEEKRVLMVTCRLRRNLSGFRFAPVISRAERRAVEKIVRLSTSKLQGPNAGRFYSVAGMPNELPMKPRNVCVLLPRFHSSPLRTCYRDWPDARSVFIADDNAATVHINCGSEHIEIVTAAPRSNNAREAFERAVEWAGLLDEGFKEQRLEVSTHPKLGHLTSDLNHIGSGVTIEVTVVAPKVAAQARFADILKRLRVRLVTDFTSNPPSTLPTPSQLDTDDAAQSPTSKATDTGVLAAGAAVAPPPLLTPMGVDQHATSAGVFTICNSETLSETPADALQTVIDAVTKIIELEAQLEKPAQVMPDQEGADA